MSRDYEPQAGQWYEDLDNEEAFQVLSVDPDEEIIRIQWPDREIREIDLDQWNEMDLELAVRAGRLGRRRRGRRRRGRRRLTKRTRTRTTTGTTRRGRRPRRRRRRIPRSRVTRPPSPAAVAPEALRGRYPHELERTWQPAGAPAVTIRAAAPGRPRPRATLHQRAVAADALPARSSTPSRLPASAISTRLLDLDYYDRLAIGRPCAGGRRRDHRRRESLCPRSTARGGPSAPSSWPMAGRDGASARN